MKILIVGMTNSIHLARWIKHLYGYKELQVYILPAFPCMTNPLLLKISKLKNNKSNINVMTLFSNNFLNYFIQRIFFLFLGEKFYIYWLKKKIIEINPKYLHSHELTTSGILCLKTKLLFKSSFPKWIVSNWGSDIFYFIKKKKYKKYLLKILKQANFYSAECYRDYVLATKNGVKASFLNCALNSGGINLKLASKLRSNVVTSSRKFILIKGYHGMLGLGLLALKAILKVSSKIQRYKIIIYSADDEVVKYYEENKKKINLDIKIYSVKNKLSEDKMYKLFSLSKIFIGISKSDGVSTACLEAMAMGAFPIQSNTSCANEWLKNGISGYLVKNNISFISKRILIAIKNDLFVNRAASINWKIIKKNADSLKFRKIIRSFYI